MVSCPTRKENRTEQQTSDSWARALGGQGLHLMPGQCVTKSSHLPFLDMEQTEGSPSEDGTTVSPTAGNLGPPGSQSTTEEVAAGTAESSVQEGAPGEAGQPCEAASEGAVSGPCLEDGNRSDELTVDAQEEASGKEGAKADPAEEDGKEETTTAPEGETGKKEETKSEPSEVKGKEETRPTSEAQKADGKEADLDTKGKSDVNDKVKPELKEAVVAEATVEKAETESQEKADVKDQAELEAVDGTETGSDAKELQVSRA